MNRKYILKKDAKDDRDYVFSLTPHQSVKIPSSIDLRELCPAVYDQGQEGSCTANAGCAARVMLMGNITLNLSRAFLYYEERNLEGTTSEDSGANIRDICKATQNFGICEDVLMPYTDQDYTTPPSNDALQNGVKYKITAYKRLTSLDDIKKSLAFNQRPVLIGMTVYESMESDIVAQTGQLPLPAATEQELGGHAVLVVGYKDTITQKKCIFNRNKNNTSSAGYLIIRNSWGEVWGDKGYFYMPYEYFNKYTNDYWIFE